jgi:hypothetical protein
MRETMRKYIFTLAFLIISLSSLNAQLKDGDNLLGVSVGFWGKGNVPTFGINFESQITDVPSGTIGIGGLFRFYTLSNSYSNGDSWRHTFTSLGFQSNYNFNQIGEGKFVPFVGLVLGYNNVNSTFTDVSRSGIYVSESSYSSDAWLWAQLGFRYFFSPRVAGALRVGAGNNNFNTIELGVDFKL